MSHKDRFQSHQNKYGFRHNKNSKKTTKILALPNSGLCKRCYDIIEWRKKFRKYKPLKDPGKCADCLQRTVKLAYHTLCPGCAEKRGTVCAKCCLSRDIIQEEKSNLEENDVMDMLLASGVKERHRRTILRIWEKNEATDEEIIELINKYDKNLKEEEELKLDFTQKKNNGENTSNHANNTDKPLTTIKKATGVDNIKVPDNNTAAAAQLVNTDSLPASQQQTPEQQNNKATNKREDDDEEEEFSDAELFDEDEEDYSDASQ
jgi:hypothetical protein